MDERNTPPVDESGLNDNNIKADQGEVSPTVKGEHKQRGLFKKTRGGVVLTREEVKEIKIGRKVLRKQLRERGIKSRKEFELIASSLGLYFDKRKWFPLLLWFLHGRGLAALLGALVALMAVLFGLSLISQMQGHFTINLSDKLFREGFTLSETVGFENPTMHLLAQPVENAPCISISDIREDVTLFDGQLDESRYFAYTFYIRNEGDNTVGYNWSCRLNSESKDLSDAAWVMIFEDDRMKFYAEPREDGTSEALPYYDDNSRGYIKRPLADYAANPEDQYEPIVSSSGNTFYRLIPYSFLSDTLIANGTVTEVEPFEAHKYTVVIWLEGDDPDCTNDLIGGHAGMDMQFEMIDESNSEEKEDNSLISKWNKFWDGLTFWEE